MQASISGQLHATGTTVEAEPGEVEHLVRLGYLVPVHRPVREVKAKAGT